MKSIRQEKKLVVVLMGKSSRSTTKEHFVPPRRYTGTHYYYNMLKAMTFKRSKMTFLGSIKSGVMIACDCDVIRSVLSRNGPVQITCYGNGEDAA